VFSGIMEQVPSPSIPVTNCVSRTVRSIPGSEKWQGEAADPPVPRGRGEAWAELSVTWPQHGEVKQLAKSLTCISGWGAAPRVLGLLPWPLCRSSWVLLCHSDSRLMESSPTPFLCPDTLPLASPPLAHAGDWGLEGSSTWQSHMPTSSIAP